MELLKGKFIIEDDGVGWTVSRRQEVTKKDGEKGFSYCKTYYGSFKACIIAVINQVPYDCKDLKEVLDRLKELENLVLRKL